MILTGQITQDTPLGQALTELARKADTIVEIGTGSGLGSTLCLLAGMERLEQRFWTVEADPDQRRLATQNLTKNGQHVLQREVESVWGVIHLHISTFMHPIKSPQHLDMWKHERSLIGHVPLVIDEMPEAIDLLLLDGGEWTSNFDFAILSPRSKVIVIDDCNPAVAFKNVHAREWLLADSAFRIVREELNDRNGWMIAERI